MRISELVAALERIKAEHGDLECDTIGYAGDRVPLELPTTAYRKILGKRERKDDFWCELWDDAKQRGEKVVRL